jgi:hypothetical protein
MVSIAAVQLCGGRVVRDRQQRQPGEVMVDAGAGVVARHLGQGAVVLQARHAGDRRQRPGRAQVRVLDQDLERVARRVDRHEFFVRGRRRRRARRGLRACVLGRASASRSHELHGGLVGGADQGLGAGEAGARQVRVAVIVLERLEVFAGLGHQDQGVALPEKPLAALAQAHSQHVGGLPAGGGQPVDPQRHARERRRRLRRGSVGRRSAAVAAGRREEVQVRVAVDAGEGVRRRARLDRLPVARRAAVRFQALVQLLHIGRVVGDLPLRLPGRGADLIDQRAHAGAGRGCARHLAPAFLGRPGRGMAGHAGVDLVRPQPEGVEAVIGSVPGRVEPHRGVLPGVPRHGGVGQGAGAGHQLRRRGRGLGKNHPAARPGRARRSGRAGRSAAVLAVDEGAVHDPGELEQPGGLAFAKFR